MKIILSFAIVPEEMTDIGLAQFTVAESRRKEMLHLSTENTRIMDRMRIPPSTFKIDCIDFSVGKEVIGRGCIPVNHRTPETVKELGIPPPSKKVIELLPLIAIQPILGDYVVKLSEFTLNIARTTHTVMESPEQRCNRCEAIKELMLPPEKLPERYTLDVVGHDDIVKITSVRDRPGDRDHL
ncbi:hypothetical protein ABH15_00610 [Methanoculleus taiwanensis]|uniref:Uncharacterized protein n=1 Tax=Methanoculleus taiwanensis TaxID=1550565 RepID=A0A498H2L3_9EURY|nr:hypothetical protein ABH15_00610 [Methanoculleus taiwanensis]